MLKLGQLRTCLDKMTTRHRLVTFRRAKHLHNLPTSITIGNAQFPFKQSVKNLGFTLNCHLTMNAHVTNIALSAFVFSRIDYCNLLLFGSTHDLTSHLQRIQNNASRVILLLPKSFNITIHLKSLYFLCSFYSIQFYVHTVLFTMNGLCALRRNGT